MGLIETVGLAEGVLVGVFVGVRVGVADGMDVGEELGEDEGLAVGVADGVEVGCFVKNGRISKKINVQIREKKNTFSYTYRSRWMGRWCRCR